QPGRVQRAVQRPARPARGAGRCRRRGRGGLRRPAAGRPLDPRRRRGQRQRRARLDRLPPGPAAAAQRAGAAHAGRGLGRRPGARHPQRRLRPGGAYVEQLRADGRAVPIE
ncbi:MAG: hypothetical protein MZW92_13885, partial [Comamonadaceae bacterium]|nr:hypothetical protein [Comamonadaceae bacterium]